MKAIDASGKVEPRNWCFLKVSFFVWKTVGPLKGILKFEKVRFLRCSTWDLNIGFSDYFLVSRRMMFLVLVCLLLSTRVMAFPPAEAPAVVHFSSLAALAYIYSISWWIRASIHESNFGCCVLVLNYLFINLLAYLFIKIFIYLFVYSVCLCIYLLSLDTQIIWSASASFMHLILYLCCFFMSWFALIFQCLMYLNHSLLMIVYCIILLE